MGVATHRDHEDTPFPDAPVGGTIYSLLNRFDRDRKEDRTRTGRKTQPRRVIWPAGGLVTTS